jgi:hypothetical protein
VRDENSVSWNMKEDTGYLIVLGGGCFFKFLWRNVFHAERMLQLIELGVNAHGRIQDFEMASWRLDLSFDNEPSASSTSFGDKAALPFCITEVNSQYVWGRWEQEKIWWMACSAD